MKREIKIFKSFEEQEEYHLEVMRLTTPLQRLQSLFDMQQLTRLLHPAADNSKRIIIHKNGYIK
jgi:hypothetical protein